MSLICVIMKKRKGSIEMIGKVRENKIYLLLLFLLIVIIIISMNVLCGNELVIDTYAYDILVVKLRCSFLTSFMKLMTKFSNTSVIVFLVVFFNLLFHNLSKKRIAVIMDVNLGVIVLINQVLKFLIRRERPIGYRLIEMTGYSFPSGHAMVSMAFYGLLIYFITKLVRNKWVKRILVFVNVMIIILIGISRVYLGVHYFSDIVIGYLISFIYLFLVIKIINKYKFFT